MSDLSDLHGIYPTSLRWNAESGFLAVSAFYGSGVSDERIAVYLKSREIGLTSPVLRFQEQAPHRLGARLPAMLAPVVNVTGEQIGVHLTYLRRDGGGKATLPKEYQRECRGAIHGAAIRLAEHDPDRRD